MPRTRTYGSLEATAHDNGLVTLKITALRRGEPTSIVSTKDLQDLVDWVLEDDDDDLEDLVDRVLEGDDDDLEDIL